MAGVSIQLGGKERTLKFSFLSLKALEQHYGKSISKVFDEEMNKGGLEQLSVLIWACLRKEKLTLNKIDELIDNAIEDEEIDINELSERLQQALQESKIAKNVVGESGDEAKN
jgi:translation elongation factor EF-G